ncbi:amidase [Pelagibius sp. Alg239-R121]|uniref:amidase n=1 Tax=Pelagibius sp. Alg239-R121 TaxID=2993448 RepID=UPI0024A61957|nr:amidase [Pelagibius sp. Alg239-R121]
MKRSESLSEQVAALADGSQTASFLAERSLERAKKNAGLNAFAALDERTVLAQAEAATQRRSSGKTLSPIDGVPIAVKDNYLTKDYPTTACSNAAPLEPSGTDATLVANLRAAGAVIFAKTNMHEWAYGATNDTSTIGVTRNPHNLDHITGGSSGGSGAAVAAGIVAAALGSDTGGSVRIPSSACGIYGFKPSYGRASRNGVLPLSWSLDAPGPMTAALEDIGHLLPFFLGADPKDNSTFNAAPFGQISFEGKPKLLSLTGKGLERSDEVDAAIRSALSTLDAAITEAQLANVTGYFAAWEAILHCEATAYHNALLAKNPEGFTSVTRAHLEAGRRLTGVEFLEAQKLRTHLLKVMLNELPDWDALVLPTLPVPAPPHGQDKQKFGGRSVTTQDSMTWFCWIGNLAGLPCLTIPVGKSSKGLPIGMMLMGKPGCDEKLLAIARNIDQSINGGEA